MQIGTQGEATVGSTYDVTPSCDSRVHVARERRRHHSARIVKLLCQELLLEPGEVCLVDVLKRTVLHET